ncbi:hypothetical protein L227DRAFT_173492 [Lentinus tigrinus ALCF2SS1-6]|uniref:Uncharacterized protein n=1 Tax=Lentinus tigrinus ALCF2SS1-6 TaxID=1328759 RepID=A0A5C2S5L6_9APHY|nr:hypothetical protein L227DRAFT_173492 [Lentinus tigrinus ALCF2SS1-6]
MSSPFRCFLPDRMSLPAATTRYIALTTAIRYLHAFSKSSSRRSWVLACIRRRSFRMFFLKQILHPLIPLTGSAFAQAALPPCFSFFFD